jgi:multisubunit Na+/H+ antiporter MnhB subunit
LEQKLSSRHNTSVVQVGFGLGLTQGLIAGLMVGAVVVLAVSISGLRRSEKGRLNLDDETSRRPTNGFLINIVVSLIGSAITLPVGLIVGSLTGDYACKERRFADEKATTAPALASDPSMSSMTIEMFTGDGNTTNVA